MFHLSFSPHPNKVSSRRASLGGLLLALAALCWLMPAQAAPGPGMHGPFTASTAGVVVNQYAILGANAAAGATSITVTNINHFTNAVPFNSAVNDLEEGELLLVIQMQGASVRTTDDADYGIVTNYNGAGTYEFVYVNAATNTNTINLKCALKNSYTTAGRTQVVRVPQFTTLTIDVGASITSTPWNYTGTLLRSFIAADVSIQQLTILPTTPASALTFPSADNRGGIVAVHVSGALALNGSIDVTGHGFRPGLIDGTTSPADATVYTFYRTPNDLLGASKGEGIAGYHADYDAFGGRYGRGAMANGGGGGNSHNGAGGGGANGHNGIPRFRGAGIMSIDVASWAQAWALDADFIANGNTLVTANSGGGRGGYTYASSNQNALLVGPSNSAWSGDRRDPSGGLGGHALANIADSRVFMGGGGGAGENNSNSAERGGRGGGIVYVFANTITGAGDIIANGEGSPKTQRGTPGLHGGNDGASGGGGGGSILVNTTALDAAADLIANGGDGGDQEIDITFFAAESEGAGGGGGGGYIVATVALTAANAFVAGGQYGTSNSNAVTEFTPNGATSGCTGLIESAGLASTTIPVFAACSVDFDEDGIGDATDVDDDNDGIPDAYDVCPTGASGITDFDCLQDVLDNDIVGGTGAGIDPSKDEDGDGILNYLDKTDGDGGSDFFNSCTDADANGICDNLPLLLDRDRDGVPNFYDRDSDGDGIADIIEIGGLDLGDGQISAMFDGVNLLLDFDEDGAVATGDPDADTDADGLLATYDADGETVPGVSLVTAIADKDADGIPNFLDLDSDNDGIPDVIEAGGNDSDGDGKPDVSSDSDGDGYSDAYDQDQDGKLGMDGTGTVQTLIYGSDGDGDFLLDAGEYLTSSSTFLLSPDNHNYGGAGLSPTRFAVDNLVNWLDLDSDGDGIPDLVEAGGADDTNNGTVDATTDTDLDGYSDTYDPDIDLTLDVDAGREARPLVFTLFDNNSDGLNGEGYVTSDDIDSDIFPNYLDIDSDDDGMPDFPEATLYPAGTLGRASNDEPTATTRNYHPASGAYADGDSDGWGNVAETTPVLDPPNDADADGKITTEWYTSSGSASPNFDGDIVPDLYDFDSDNDGILDVDEMIASGTSSFATGTKPGSTIGYFLSHRTRYAAAAGLAPPNSDATADGYDYRDIDADNDNHRDWIEGRDGTNDANQDALYEYYLKGKAWYKANCPSTTLATGCAVYDTAVIAAPLAVPPVAAVIVDSDNDNYPDWLDMDDNTPTSNQGTNFTPPFLIVGGPFYVDEDADGLVDLFDPTYNGTPSTEPTGTGASTPSQFAQLAAAGVPSYRNSLVNVTLPVEWVLTEVQPSGGNSVINWQLSDESLVDFYQVERSFTGQPDDFAPISNLVDATGGDKYHSFTDIAALKLPASVLYYRVRAVGINGGASYSTTLALSTDGRQIHMVAYPNPAHETLMVETALQESATLRLISVIGQTVRSLPVEAGTTVQMLPLGGVPPGLYLLVLSDGSTQVPVLIQ